MLDLKLNLISIQSCVKDMIHESQTATIELYYISADANIALADTSFVSRVTHYLAQMSEKCVWYSTGR